MVTCPSCGQENPEGFRFCGACASALTEEAPAPREERKVVTVLFADLVGFTSRAETLDPEEVRAVLQPYHARLRSELERRGGTVEKFIGDAVMALFGAPVAHEDDPERAVRAALSIRNRIAEQGEDLQVRIAVATGEALVTLGARPVEGEGMAAGDVVNTAARLQAAAPVNGILVGETTYHATRHVIEYGEAELVSAKGKAKPIRAWEALQARSRFGVDVEQTAQAPLIGRENELDALRDALARARSQRSVQLVTVVGVPGIGKSRLVYELAQAVEAEPELVTWRQGRCLPYGEGVSFWALGEIVKAQAGILESDRSEEAEEKLGEATAVLVPDDAERRWIESHLGTLVGLGGEETRVGDGRAESFAAWRGFLEALAEQRPLVLVVEDLHWADDGLLDFVDQLVDRATEVPLLVLCTARPELLERRPGWGGGKPNALTLSLPPLDDADTGRLVGALLERPLLAAETQAALLEHAGGVPLYAEQYAHMLRERGELEELPETVQGIIAARLDALAVDEKGLLQDAAVVGKVFWLGALEATGGVARQRAEELLHGLERKEFVKRARRASVDGETEYAFRHVLLRDVAYGQIPRAARAEKHDAAARWIETLGRPEDHAEMLAYHYVQALQYARAMGTEDPAAAERARLTLRDAGDRALSLGGYAASARFYAAALDLWPVDDRERPDLLFRCGRARFWAEGTGLEQLLEAFEDFRAAGRREGAAEVARWLARLFWTRGERDTSYAYVDRALALVEGLPPSPAKAEALLIRSGSHVAAGEYPEAIRIAREALPIAELLGLDGLRSRALSQIGGARALMGDAEGLLDIERAIELARDANAFDYLHNAYNNLRGGQLFLGRLEAAARTLEPYRESVERFGTGFERRWVQADEALECFMHGRWDDAIRVADSFLAEVDEGSPHYRESACRALRASIRLARGDRAGALSDSERGVELARGAKDPQVLAPALSTRAAVLLAEGRCAEAGSLASEVLALGPGLVPALANEFSGTPIDFTWLVCDLGRAEELLAVLEDAAGVPWAEAARAIASGDFGRAADVLGEIGFRPGEAYTRLRAAESLVREGRSAEAEVELEGALGFYRGVGAIRFVREGEELLAGTVEQGTPREVTPRTSTNQ